MPELVDASTNTTMHNNADDNKWIEEWGEVYSAYIYTHMFTNHYLQAS